MEVKTTKEKAVLKLSYDGGIVDGKEKILSKSYSKLRLDAEDENLLKVGEKLAKLQEKELLSVAKVETSTISYQ